MRRRFYFIDWYVTLVVLTLMLVHVRMGDADGWLLL